LYGTPADERRYPNERLVEAFDTARDIAQHMDALGFEERYPGLDQMMIHWAEGIPPAEFKEQLRWFARDVMPAFSG
jgi:hypothetical protein